jgi:hypothetical protein
MGSNKRTTTKRSARSGSKEDLPKTDVERKVEDFFGLLAGKTNKVATIEEIHEAAANGWAGINVPKRKRQLTLKEQGLAARLL